MESVLWYDNLPTIIGGSEASPHTSDITTFHPHYANVYVLISESVIALSTYVGMTYDLP